MASESSWILLCLVICSVGVTTRSLEDYGYDGYDYESLYQRSNTAKVQDEPASLKIAMPNIHPVKHDSYFCTSVKVDDPNTYIIGFEPHAEMHTAHHMLLFGCSVPGDEKKSWNCGDMGSGVCGRGSGEKIMYAWGRNAPVLKLPEDVAFQIGDPASKYLVLQVHYGHVDKFKNDPKLTDQSGVTLKTTKQRRRHSAAILVLASGGEIPAQKKAYSLNLACKYENQAVIHPFAFRVHAHSLGSVITGYRVRDNKWTLIGKGDPQRPQAFYPINKDVSIKNGDVLAARCTYNSMKRHRTTYIGATMKDEMCNFYMMFYYDPKTTRSSPEDSCGYANVNPAAYPADSEVPLPGSGQKMEMKRDEDECPECNAKRTRNSLVEKQNWPEGGKHDGVLPFNVGQISGVSMDTNGNVVIFHRSSRPWQGDTFDGNNGLTKKYRTPIPEYTVHWLDAKTGKVVKKPWGNGLFYLPHGLMVDKEDNLWLTDVGSHQVFKFPPNTNTPSITLGTKLVPGSDLKHFCKPTGVALDSDGNFFVSDGYCNQRVLKFSPSGSLLLEITNKELSQGPAPHFFSIPHSVSIDKSNNVLYVADRENGRVLVFDTKTGELNRDKNVITGFGSRVFAAHYSSANGGVLHVVNGQESYDMSTIRGFTYSLTKNAITQTWRPKENFEMPHDIASDSAGDAVYVAEIKHPGGRIWKFV